MIQIKRIINHPWTVGVGTVVMAELILAYLVASQSRQGWQSLIIGLAMLFFVLSTAWYWFELSYQDSESGSEKRDRYNRLRSNYIGLNKPSDTPWGEAYRHQVTEWLNNVTTWFGDKETPNSSPFCQALGLHEPRALLTLASYEGTIEDTEIIVR